MTDPIHVVVIGDKVQPARTTVAALSEHLGERANVVGHDWAVADFTIAAFAAEDGARSAPPVAWHEDIGRAHVLVTHFFPISEAVAALARNLELVATLRTGSENIDQAALEARGIALMNNPGREADAVSDFTVALVLDAIRRVTSADHVLRTRGWSEAEEIAGRPRNLRELVVGLVGFGHVGQLVARKLSGFGAELLVADPLVARSEITAAGARPVELDALLRESDVVSLHARLSSETRGLIGARELALLPRHALLVNTARAHLVDERALIAALRDGQIGGVALDVFWHEPVPEDHPLLQRDDVILTPHIAGSTLTSQADSVALLATRVTEWLEISRPSSRRRHDLV